MTGTGLMLCDDLIFASKVTATAAAQGMKVVVRKTPDTLLAAAKENPPTGVILDLQTPGLDVPTLLVGLNTQGRARPRVVGFGSHVDAETLNAARAAGCDEVMPRSRFVKELEEKLPTWLQHPGDVKSLQAEHVPADSAG